MTYRPASKAFIVGVLQSLKEAKAEINEREIAAGFLVLSTFTLKELR